MRRLTTAAVSELESEAVATEEHEWSVPRTRQAFVDFFAEKKAHTPYASGPVVRLASAETKWYVCARICTEKRKHCTACRLVRARSALAKALGEREKERERERERERRCVCVY